MEEVLFAGEVDQRWKKLSWLDRQYCNFTGPYFQHAEQVKLR